MEIYNSADLLFSATAPSAAMMESISGSALGRGIDAFTAGNYSMAIQQFKQTISLSPYSDNAFKAFGYLADALVKSDKTTTAIETYKQAIKIFPSADGLNLSLGNLLFSEGREEEAIEQYKAAVRKNPSVSENLYALGQGYLALEQYDKAEEQFKRVIQMSPQDSAGYYALGQTYRKTGRYDEAENLLNKALSIKKDFSYVHYELGMIYAEKQQMDKARAELAVISEDAPELFPDLQKTIDENSAPRFILAYIDSLNLSSGPGTKVSSLDSTLTTPGASKNFTISFVFDKEMDPASIQNIVNWEISRSSSTETGGIYNWGKKVPDSEIRVSPMPVKVTYDSELLTAKVTFKITQNASANGTIDPSHLVFKFQGTNVYGNSMSESADQYNRFSKII